MTGRDFKWSFRKPKRARSLAEEYALFGQARTIGVTGMVGSRVVELGPRCPTCGKKVAEYLARPYKFQCRGCGTEFVGREFQG